MDWSGSPIRLAAIYLVFLVIGGVLQVSSGTYGAELGHYPDEPAHVVTSLMIHDYLLDGLGASPLAYAKNYYLHYPRVSIGIWPPVYHTTTAFWMMLFGPNETSLLVYMACQMALLATLLTVFARRLFSPLISLALGLGILFLPLVQYSGSIVMLDLMVSLYCFVAMMFMCRYIETGKKKDAIIFSIVTAVGMLTKANANSLVVTFGILFLLSRKWELLRDRWLYVAGAIIVLLGGPWQVISMRLFAGVVPMAKVDWPYISNNITGYFQIFWDNSGAAIFSLALLGMVLGVQWLLSKKPQQWGERDAALAGSISLLAGVYGFHCFSPTPGPEPRYTVAGIAPMMVLFAYGIQRLAQWVASRGPVSEAKLAAGLAVVAAIQFFGWHFMIEKREAKGMREVAQAIQARGLNDEAMLVVSDADGEGGLLTSIALHEKRPSRYFLRASKQLSPNLWRKNEYGGFYKTPAELEAWLDSVPVDVVVLDKRVFWPEEGKLMSDTMKAYEDIWNLELTTAEYPGGRQQRLYRRRKATPAGQPKKISIRIDMLNQDFSNKK